MTTRCQRKALPLAAALALGLAGLLGASPLRAQEEEQAHGVRGTLQAASENGLVVRTRTGEVLGLALKEGAGIFVTTPAGIGDIGQGDYVGLTSIDAGGRRVAIGAHLFAPELRGLGEGHMPWDLVEGPNTMTNATVAEVREVGQDRELTVSYGEGGRTATQTIMLPPDVPLARLERAPRPDVLEAGRKVFVMVEAPRNGVPQAVAVVVEQGAAPPM